MPKLLKISIYSLLLIALISVYGYRYLFKDQKPVLESYGYPTTVVPVKDIRTLLSNKEFGKLNTLLDNYQQEFNKDYRYEMVLRDAYNAFCVNNLTYQPLFTEWLKQYPDSYQPYLAHAFYSFNLGWTSRGGKWANKTSEEQLANMAAYFNNAEKDINKVIALNNKNILPYSLLIQMVRTKAQDNRKDLNTYLQKALDIAPLSFLIRYNYLKSIAPRWGGSWEAMTAFIEETKKYQADNKKLAILQGLIDYEYAETDVSQKNYANALSHYDKALSFGDYSAFYYGRASAHLSLEQYDAALEDINQAIALESLKSEFYLERAKIQAARQQFKQAVLDINTADAMNPFNTDILAEKRWITDILFKKGANQAGLYNTQEAIDLLNLALLATPNAVPIYQYLAHTYIEKNDFKNAMDILKKAIAVEPNDFNNYQMMDWVLNKTSAKGADLNAMIVYWNQYIALHPENTKAYLYRGSAFYRKGDSKAALNEYKKAADLGDSEGKELYERFSKLH